jgi:hypothetical protein
LTNLARSGAWFWHIILLIASSIVVILCYVWFNNIKAWYSNFFRWIRPD